MAASGYSPISLYYSTTASATPTNTNLVNGELALNITDGKLFYKDNAGTVQTLATKAATSGSFSTTTISTSETLSYGTANGVAYLNGSKVVTTGSALTFDGTNLLIGSPAFPSSGRIQLKQANDSTKQKGLLIEASGDDSILAIGYDGSAFTFNPTYNTTGAYKPMAWWVSGSEQMRLTSTGLGIGTSSPGAKLAVTGSSGGGYSGLFTQTATSLSNGCYTLTVDSSSHTSNLSAAGAFNVLVNSGTGLVVNGLGNLGIGTSSPNIGGVNKAITLNSATNTNCSYELAVNGVQLGALYTTISTNALNLLGIANGPLTFGTNGSERMRLDSSGNLGLGVTPSAWNLGKAFEINTVGNGLWATSTAIVIGNNFYYNSGYKYAANGYASYILQSTGSFSFNIAGNNTSGAGAAASFTQAMTLDASGNWFLGATSSAAGKAVIKDNSSGNNLWLIGRSSDGTSSISFRNNADSAYNARIECFDTGVMTFGTGTSATERARIDSSGNLGVGRTNPGVRLSVAGNSDSWQLALSTNSGSTGAVIGSPAADVLAFGSWAGTERARIDSSGNLLIGRTATGLTTAGAGINKNAGGAYFEVVQGGNGVACMYANQSYGSGSQTAFDIRFNNTQVGTINVTSTTCTFNNLSDYRLKDVIGPVAGHGDRIDLLEPIEYAWKSTGELTRGFLAHKFQEIYPTSVSGKKDDVDDEGNPKYQTMQASTAEVIADLVAEIKSLRARVAQLEAK